MEKISSFLVAVLLVSPALGYFTFKSRIPNGNIIPHPCKANYLWSGVGHTNPDGGGERNVFGIDFKNAGLQWTETLCRYDSDGDGKTNGEELGDPNCVWRPGQVPERVTGITHPGVCNPYGEGVCAGRDSFVDCSIKSFAESCEIIKKPGLLSKDYVFNEHTIPNTETNYYCQYFDLPSDQDYHILANEGLIDNRNVMHHMIMYGCPDSYQSKPTDNSPNACSMGGTEGRSCITIIAMWTVGLPGSCNGDKIGFRIGASGIKKVKLEIHYNNPLLVADYRDKSGMRIYYQPATSEVQDLMTFTIGQRYLAIPPGKESVSFDGVCPSDCTSTYITKPAYVVAAANHMHYLGRSQKTVVIRNGTLVKILAHDDPYYYDSPVPHKYETPFEILPGDVLKTTCEFGSMSQKRYVFQGQGTADEMCFSFLTIFPADAIRSKFCVSMGPLSTCDLYGRKPKLGCDWSKFLQPSNPETVKFYLDLEKNCNMDGVCRPECIEVAEKIKRHPCFGKEMNPLISSWMSRSHEGTMFLARMRSCDGHSSSASPSTQRPGAGDFSCAKDCSHMCQGDSDGKYSSAASELTTLPVLILNTATLVIASLNP